MFPQEFNTKTIAISITLFCSKEDFLDESVVPTQHQLDITLASSMLIIHLTTIYSDDLKTLVACVFYKLRSKFSRAAQSLIERKVAGNMAMQDK